MGNEELYIARRHRDFVNRFAVALAHFDIDLATGGANELKLVLPICFFRAPIQLCRKPANKQKCGRSESGRVINSYFFDFSEMMMRSGMIEELSESETRLVQSRRIQFAKEDERLCIGLCVFN